MTRDELRGIVEGISDEQLKKILDINSSDIGKAKTGAEELKMSLSSAQEKILGYETEIGTMKATVNEAEILKNKVKELQKVIDDKNAKEAEKETENKLFERFAAASEGAEFLNKYTRDGLLAEFKEALSNVQNEGKSDMDIYCELTKDKENLFMPDGSEIPMVIAASGGSSQSLADGDVREIMGLKR